VAQVWHSIRPAGVIGLEAFTDDEATTMRRAGIAVARVVFERPAATAGPGILHVPQAVFGNAQVRHLAATGHRRIGYAYPSDPRVRVYADLRLAGARRACKALGLRAPRVQRIPATADGATSAIGEWLAIDPPVTAIAAYNDQWAMALLAGLHALNVPVPRDVAVIGVDNDSVGVLTTPTLSTVSHDWQHASDYLSDTIVRGLAGEPPSVDRQDLPLRVVVRQSAP
jgi:DNA-binding LacI/PurR family transcriptional regulator